MEEAKDKIDESIAHASGVKSILEGIFSVELRFWLAKHHCTSRTSDVIGTVPPIFSVTNHYISFLLETCN